MFNAKSYLKLLVRILIILFMGWFSIFLLFEKICYFLFGPS